MVKQNFLTKMLLLCALIVGSVSSAWGQTTVTFDATTDITANAQSYQSTELTINADDGSTWKANGYGATAKTNIIIGKGGANYLETPNVNGTITSVAVTWSGNTSYYLALQTTTGTELEAKSNPSTSTTETFTVSGSYSQLRLVGRRASGTNNAAATITKVVVTYVTGGSQDNRAETTTTINVPQGFVTNLAGGTDVAAGTLTASVMAGQAAVSGATVTWTSSDETVATIGENTGVVTLKSEGITTITAAYAGDEKDYKPSSGTYDLTVINEDPNAITIWSEDFSLYSANNVPSGGTYGYVCANGGGTTKIYNDASTGGTAPELLVAKNNGSFTATIPLNQASGNLKLTYKTNAKAMSVSTTTDGISGEGSSNTYGEHTVTFTDVTTSMTSITIVFTATSGDNVRLDDIVLKGSAQPVAVEAPTFSINGGTYYSAQSVELSCATDGATIYYTTNGDEPTSSSTEYTGAITVSETMTIKAIAIKGNDQSTVSTATYTISEKNDVEFNITDQTLAYGETYTVTKGTYSGRDVITDGTISLSSDNDAVTSIDGLKITAVAVGTAKITIDVTEGDTYKSDTKTFTVTVTAPEGQTTAPVVGALFNETFAGCEGTGGNDDQWSGSIASSTLNADNNGWTFENGNGASACAKFGAGSKKGSATTPAIGKAGTLSLSFRAGAWNGNSEGTTLVLKVNEGSFDEENVEMTSKNVTLTKGEFNTFTATIYNATAATTISFEALNSSNNRFFLDDVVVTDPNAQGPSFSVTLNASGYATYCSQYPLDFTNATDYSAWQITEVSGTNITFSQITGSVMGGTGILLKGTPSTTINIASADSENGLTGNKLIGTLAPTYIAANQYYGLSGNTFKKVNAGTVPAGKALLPASLITDTTGAPSFSFIFNDGETTSIGEEIKVNSDYATNQWYDLTGRKLNSMPTTKGVYILNGKKVVVK